MSFVRFLMRHLRAAFFGAAGIILMVLGYADQATDIWAAAEPWQLQGGGALLFVFSVVLVLYRWEQEHQRREVASPTEPSTLPSTPTSASRPGSVEPEAPRAATPRAPVPEPSPTGAAAPDRPRSGREKAARVFVPPDMTPGALMTACQEKTTLEAGRVMAVYVGKWIRVKGSIRNISEHGRGLYVAVDVPSTFKGRPTESTVWMVFAGDRERLEMMQTGNEINAVGRIQKIKSVSMDLDQCELVSL